jgi:hypothetical protein
LDKGKFEKGLAKREKTTGDACVDDLCALITRIVIYCGVLVGVECDRVANPVLVELDVGTAS